MNEDKPPPSNKVPPPEQRLAMVHWFDPGLLIRTGIHAVVAKYAGRYADRRETLAALDSDSSTEVEPLDDYSAQTDGLWFDYLADTGDGWNSTYAVAAAISADRQEIGENNLPRGQFLIMGGDQVYPEAHRDIYESRLVGPFTAAFSQTEKDAAPNLYSIPGNHDWYDGLDAYADIFFRPRHKQHSHLGGWNITQTRSYFALKLSHGWWLWGIDIQLNGSMDREQQSYFNGISGQLEEGAKVILCSAEPDWVHTHLKPGHSTSTLQEISRLVDDHGGSIRLLISGDLHHYSRYEAEEGHPRQYVTCGGGGAFMHPTHVLPDQLDDPLAQGSTSDTISLKEAYPARNDSHRHAWRNLAFPAFNLKLTLALGLAYGLLGWLLHVRSLLDFALGKTIVDFSLQHDTLFGVAWLFLRTLALSPEFAVVSIGVFAALVGFSPARPISRRLLHGGIHWATQMMLLVILFCGLVEFNGRVLSLAPESPWFLLLLISQMTLFGGILSSLVFGIYLLISISWFKLHFNEAFSSLRIADYKCFLRLNIDDKGVLRVFPMKIDGVPRTASQSGPLTQPVTDLIEPAIILE